jgi:hypothetical protein
VRRFELHRDEDETGVSGTGRVCEGVEYGDGTVGLHWIVGHHRTHGTYPNMRAVEDLHGHGGRTRIVWLDEALTTTISRQGVTMTVDVDAVPAGSTEADLLYDAWAVIANVSGGDWMQQSGEWGRAAAAWRDRWHATLASANVPDAPAFDQFAGVTIAGEANGTTIAGRG